MSHQYSKNPAAVDALSPEEYHVTQESGTELPFTGEYCNNHEPGIYVDIVSGEPLFASVKSGALGLGTPWYAGSRPQRRPPAGSSQSWEASSSHNLLLESEGLSDLVHGRR